MTRVLTSVAVIALIASLSACVAIPTSGEVRRGDSEVIEAGPFLPILQGPEDDATPRSVVKGFLSASSGGAVTGFDVAREYLTTEAAAEWDPLAAVTVFDWRQVTSSYDDATGVYTYTVPVAATIDASGVMTEASADVVKDITFTVVQGADGQYRIAGLEDGIVISDADFSRFFRSVNLIFVATDESTIVPDVRWFPSNDQIATAAARELVEGPIEWLAGVVTSGFPPGSSLDVDAVVVTDGLASVQLAPGSAGSAAERSLAAKQMELTLTQIPAVREVDTTVGGLPIGGDESAVLTSATIPDELAATMALGRLGFWNGESVLLAPIDAGAVPADVDGLAMSYSGQRIAMVRSGDIWWSDALNGVTVSETLSDESAAATEEDPLIEMALALDCTECVEPSFDVSGWLWSAEASSQGELLAFAEGDEPLVLSVPWLAGRTIQSMSVSRDGTRLALLSRAGGQQIVEVMGIVRDAEGNPLGVGSPLLVDPAVSASIDVAWVDETTIAVLGQQAGDVWLTVVGGRTTLAVAYEGAASIGARYGDRTIVVLSADGSLFVRSGNGWALKANSVTAIAYAG